MGNLIKPGEIKIVSKNNEILVNIALELNIKLDGNVTNLNLSSGEISNLSTKKEEDKVQWAIPDFAPSNKIKFGKEDK